MTSRNKLSGDSVTEEEAFWVMYYFLDGYYEVAGDKCDVLDVLSALQPFEEDENGDFDGKVKGNRSIVPLENGMVWHWNEAVKKFRKHGRPTPTQLKK